MVMRVKADLLVCTDCLTFLSNGTVFDGDGMDVTGEHGERIEARHDTADLANMCLGGESRGFFHEDCECDGCGSSECGDRFTAYILEKDAANSMVR
jgi:hypothetical protein